MTTEEEFVEDQLARARDRALEDCMLRVMLEHEQVGLAPYTRTLIESTLDRAWGWTHKLPEASKQSTLARGLFVGRLLQGLRDRRLARSVRGVGKLAWELTDDGRYEARKLGRVAAEDPL